MKAKQVKVVFLMKCHSHDVMHQIQATAVHDNSTPSFESHELYSNETDVTVLEKKVSKLEHN